MPWFWGSKDDDEEYDSDEYTDGEYSGEEYDEELTDEEEEEEDNDVEKEEEVDQAKTNGDGEDDAEKEAGKEAVEEKETTKEEEDEESYVEVTEEDAASAAAKVAKAEQAEKEETPEEMRSNSLLDAASMDEADAADDHDVESASSIVEESKDNNKTQTDVVVSSSVTADDSVDDNDNDDTDDDDDDTDEDEDDSDDDKDEGEKPPSEVQTSSVPVETVSSDDESVSDDSDDEEEELISLGDKQSMLFLAAEQDRVDILQHILTEETDEDKHALLTTGIPPLHVAISFGSVGSTQSLLRMGADPSIRPNIDEVKKHYSNNESKVEIKNMGRFDGISAWELVFGNEAYVKLEASGATKRSSWMFASAIKPVGGDGNDDEDEDPVICPLGNIPPEKREGILHAFTAEALRCLGGDELDRLKELLNSGMPTTTEIADKDLYQWAVEMGAMNCEEYLRPTEAAKHAAAAADDDDDNEEKEDDSAASSKPKKKTASEEEIANARVLDRPADESTCSQLRNKLVELESLASALSACVDNLAEEVSVCHGLLLMNGGASALASHVKSLKAQKADKEAELRAAYDQMDASEGRLSAMVKAAGSLGEEVLKLSDSELKQQQQHQQQGEKSAEAATDVVNSADSETERQELLGQIEASETKIRKLRVSIADLSEESARDLKEVKRRGLSGGIDLVRNLREEIREVEFQLAEAKSLNATCQAKIGLIRARATPETKLPSTPTAAAITAATATTATTPVATKGAAEETFSVETFEDDEEEGPTETEEQRRTPSQKIATGDSQAIALRAPGKQGFFRIDLWQVLLRIIGMDRAADRRALDVAQRRKKDLRMVGGGFEKRPDPIHVMTV
ncbi:MAG: hypothetical protein SGBAC_004748 [Bacillariaceae sp.]